MKIFTRYLAAVGMLLAAYSLPASAAGSWPNGPIRLIVSYGAGGSLDEIARVLAKGMTNVLHQSVIVENVPGADGMVGVRRAIASPPDGTTFLIGITSDVALAPLVHVGAKYTSADLAGVIQVGTSGIVLAGRPSLKADNLAELAKLSQSTKDGLTFGSPGVGSFQHISMLAVSARAGIKDTHVPYNAAAQIATDVMGEHIDLVVAGLPSLLPLIQHKKLKAFAVMSHDRDPGDMDIPALGDTAGMDGLDFNLWTGVFAPKGTPKEILDQANQAIAKVLQDPEVVQAYKAMGVAVAKHLSSDEFTAFVSDDLNRLKATVKQEGIQPQ